MKRILFDLSKTQPLGNFKFHGGGKYGIEIFKRLAEYNPECLAAFYNDSIFIAPEIKEIVEKKEIPAFLLKDSTIVDVAKKNDWIIYTPLFDKYILDNESVKFIVTVHGLRSLEMPSDDYESLYAYNRSFISRLLISSGLQKIRKKYKERYIRNKTISLYTKLFQSRHAVIVTVSEHSKSSIMNFFPFVDEDNIKVCYSPSTIRNDALIRNNQYGKYWLLVSGDRWQKNALRAIKAFDDLFSDRPNLKGVVLITGISNLDNVRLQIKHKERFICMGYVDEKQLKQLYQNAYLFVYPSLNEGFGYPPLEAMNENCPVIASAISSIPEICGDAVLYFNPYLISEIKMRIIQMENKEIHDFYSKKGKERQSSIEIRQKNDLDKLCHFIINQL